MIMVHHLWRVTEKERRDVCTIEGAALGRTAMHANSVSGSE